MSLAEKIARIHRFKGAIVATIAPFTSDGKLNLEAVEPYATYLKSIGVLGVYVHGSTGEGFSLSSQERMALTGKWIQVLRSKYPEMLIIINVSSTCTSESLAESEFSEKAGADGIALLPPIFYPPKSSSGLINYIKLIAAAAPETPLIYYHISERTHVDVDFAEFIPEALKKIPTIAGCKYMSKDLASICLPQFNHKNKFKIMSGNVETVLPMLSLGIDSTVAGQFNLPEIVKLYNEMLEKFPTQAGKIVENQAKINHIVLNLKQGGNPVASIKKRISQISAGKCNPGTTRSPLFE